MNRILTIITITILTLAGCSTKKNTAITRTYHNITAHYNIYFNGEESFKAANQKIEKKHKEHFFASIPIFKYSSDDAVKLTKSEMEKTLEKMGKAITLHSITAKPKLKGKLTKKDKDFLKKNEYCQWIDNSYLLIGKANFYNRDYSKALRAFRHILNLYKTENTVLEAKLWIAKIYIAEKKYTDAFNYLNEIKSDKKRPKELDKDLNLTFADYFYAQKMYTETSEHIVKAINFSKKRKEKARLYFILAQVHLKNGELTEAAEYLKKVIKMNTNYDMTFSAKIMQATTFTKGQNSEDIKKQLKKLLKDEKNEEYKDQIYFALATIEQNENNMPKAIEYFKLSAAYSVSNNAQKAASFLAIADMFFDEKKYVEAGHYYDSTMQYINKNHENYDQITIRAKNTGKLVKSLSIVQIQDSLQRIAKMSEKNRLNFIDNMITQVKISEQQQQQQQNSAYYDPLDQYSEQNVNNNQSQAGQWYMYNQIMISRGKTEFRKKWGTRKLEDNWRRKNKSANIVYDEEEEKESIDSARVTDNKKREFYLQDLPLTDSLMKISDDKIMYALFNAADVYYFIFNETDEAIKMYNKLLEKYPKTKLKLETLFRLYNIYKELKNKERTNYYKNQIITQFPNSKYAKSIIDPDFAKKLEATGNEALNLYNNALKSYNNNNFRRSLELANQGIQKFPDAQIYPFCMFLKAKSFGHINQQDSMVYYLEKIKTDFEKSDIGNLANDILVLINTGKYNYDIYKKDDNQSFLFVIIINKKYYTNEFKFNLKTLSENFSSKKTFEIINNDFDKNTEAIAIRYFDNATEGADFYRKVVTGKLFDNILENEFFVFFISKSNFEIFQKDRVVDKYLMFFKKNYSF